MENTERLVLTLSEVADVLGLSRPTIYKLAKNGDIPTLKLGHKVVVSKIQLNQLLSGEYENNKNK